MKAIQEGTKIKALREARSLLQTFGFNGFSFQHIADSLGIKKPSLYDHFKSKEELGQEIIKGYYNDFLKWTETIQIFEPKDKIGALFEMFFKFSSSDAKICPLSALTADYNSLPKSIQKLLAKTYDLQKDWLKTVIAEGQKKKVFRQDRTNGELSDIIMSLGLGSQLVARVSEDPGYLKDIKEQALKLLVAK